MGVCDEFAHLVQHADDMALCTALESQIRAIGANVSEYANNVAENKRRVTARVARCRADVERKRQV